MSENNSKPTDNTKDPSKPEKSKLQTTGADEEDIDILKKYGKGPYAEKIKTIEDDVKEKIKTLDSATDYIGYFERG